MVKRVLLQTVQWCAAAVISLLLFNIVLFAYEKPAGWIDRSNASTDAIWNPGSLIIHSTEGHGVYTVDAKGYLNDAIPKVGGGKIHPNNRCLSYARQRSI